MENYHEEGLVFFSDITNFRKTTKNMELDQATNLLTSFAEITNRTVTLGGGQVIDYINDSALGYFPSDGVDKGVLALMEMKYQVEERFQKDGYKMKLRVGAHYGPYMIIYMTPFTTPDLFGDTVNITFGLGAGGQASHRGRLILSSTAFRKLAPETRKSFHKYTEPIVYLAE